MVTTYPSSLSAPPNPPTHTHLFQKRLAVDAVIRLETRATW